MAPFGPEGAVAVRRRPGPCCWQVRNQALSTATYRHLHEWGTCRQGAELFGANLTIAKTAATPTAISPIQTTAEPLLCVAKAANGSRMKRIAIPIGTTIDLVLAHHFQAIQILAR